MNGINFETGVPEDGTIALCRIEMGDHTGYIVGEYFEDDERWLVEWNHDDIGTWTVTGWMVLL